MAPAWRNFKNIFFTICTWPDRPVGAKILSGFQLEGKTDVWISQVRRVKASVLGIIKEWIVDPKRNYGNKQNDAYFYDDECKEQDSGYIYENECIKDKVNSDTDLQCFPGQEVSKKASDLSQHKISVKSYLF